MMQVRTLLVTGSGLSLVTYMLVLGTAIAFDVDEKNDDDDCLFQTETSPYVDVLIAAAVLFSVGIVVFGVSIAMVSVGAKTATAES